MLEGAKLGQGVNLFGENKRINVEYTYCSIPIDGDELGIIRTGFDYVTLRLGETCPIGSSPFRRYQDMEDTDNDNSYTGNIGPNVIDRNASLEYCFVPKDISKSNKLPYGNSYMYMAPWETHFNFFTTKAKVKIDDEDRNNDNEWYFYGKGDDDDLVDRINQIVYGKGNTYFNIFEYLHIDF